MNSVVFNRLFLYLHSHYSSWVWSNTMVTFDVIAVSFEVNHVMHRGDLLFIMANRVCGVLKVLQSPSYGP